jgi:hypothetical protein
MWDRLAVAAHSWLRVGDLDHLQVTCEQLDRREVLRIEVLREAASGVYDLDRYRSLLDLEGAISRGLGWLGFTPVDRTRLALEQVEAWAVLAAIQQSASGRKGGDAAE